MTTVEPPEVVATAAEPLEVSVVSTHQLFACPVAARRAVPELSSCPVTAIEAVCESSFCPVTSMEAVCELLPCSEPAMGAGYELSSWPEPAMEANYELLFCSEPAEEVALCLSALSVTAEEAVSEHSVLPVPINGFDFEQSVCTNVAVESVTELSASASVNAPDYELSSRETIDEHFVFPALTLGAQHSLSVSCVSVFILFNFHVVC